MTRNDDLAPLVADGTSPQMIRRAFERVNKRVDVLRTIIDSTNAEFSITVSGIQVGTLSGVLKASGGTVSVATSGTDYQAAITSLTEETSPAGTSFVGLHTGSAYKKTKLTDIWSAGFTQQSHIVDASTSHTITDPSDSPASADALRDDLVTNTIPSIETQLNALGVKINAVITALENSGITATS